MSLHEAGRASGGDQHFEHFADELASRILPIMREVLGRPDLTIADEAMDHGGTSLSIVRILTEANQQLGLTIDPRDLGGVVTAKSLAAAAR